MNRLCFLFRKLSYSVVDVIETRVGEYFSIERAGQGFGVEKSGPALLSPKVVHL